MNGEKDLSKLLRGMEPVLNPGEYVFCLFPQGTALVGLAPIFTFREEEGLTAILSREEARAAGCESGFVARWITLRIHSDLAAVGFLARITAALAQAGIPCNAVSAFFHDHLFMPPDQADQALEVLKELQRQA